MHKALKILIASSILYNFAAGMFGPIYAVFVLSIGGDLIAASTAWAIYAIILGFLTMFFGRIEDRLNKKLMLVIGRLIDTIGFVGYLLISSPLHLFVVQGILGIAAAIKDPAFDAIFSRSLDKKKTATEWSYQLGSTQIAWGIAALLGGVIVTIFGFRVLFIFMAMISALATIVVSFLLRKKIWKGFFMKRKN